MYSFFRTPHLRAATSHWLVRRIDQIDCTIGFYSFSGPNLKDFCFKEKKLNPKKKSDDLTSCKDDKTTGALQLPDRTAWKGFVHQNFLNTFERPYRAYRAHNSQKIFISSTRTDASKAVQKRGWFTGVLNWWRIGKRYSSYLQVNLNREQIESKSRENRKQIEILFGRGELDGSLTMCLACVCELSREPRCVSAVWLYLRTENAISCLTEASNAAADSPPSV